MRTFYACLTLAQATDYHCAWHILCALADLQTSCRRLEWTAARHAQAMQTISGTAVYATMIPTNMASAAEFYGCKVQS